MPRPGPPESRRVRRIPIEFQPLPGESLDSWLMGYAARLHTTLGDLTDALGIGGLFISQPAGVIALGRRAPDTTGLVAATGLPAEDLEALWQPLARYAAIVRCRFGTQRIARALRPMMWSRFCKECLVESGGRWPAAWRLPWFVTCPTHGVLLSSTCPGCGHHQLRSPLRHDEVPEGGRCSVPRPGASGRGPNRCGAELAAGAPDAHAIPLALAVQNRLSVLVDPLATDQALSGATDHLADLFTIASLTGLDFDGLNAAGLTDTASIDAALHRADIVLSDETGEALTDLATGDMHKRPHPLPLAWRTASPPLIASVLSIRDPRLRPVDRLRWRTATVGRLPEGRLSHVPSRRIPEALWPDWSVRLKPRSGVEASAFRVVAAAVLGLVGSRCPVPDLIAAQEGTAPAAFMQKLSYCLQTVAATEHGRAILQALTQLSDGLRVHGSPIDYERRRQLAATGPLIELAAWDGICAAAGVPTGGQRKLRNARLWIWETLTGGLPQQAPGVLRPSPIGLAIYHRFALDLSDVAVNLLEDHVRKVLDGSGCESEPLTWSPPSTWVDAAGLPVPDLDCLDLDRLGTLLRRKCPVTAIAEELGTSLEHVRLVVQGDPGRFRPAGQCRRSAAPPDAVAHRNARTLPPPDLTTERLRTLVVEENRTLRSLAPELGVGRKYLADRLRRDGIPVPPSRRRPVHIVDPEWLRVEYLQRRRTLPDIAAEVGTTAPNIARIAHQHGIELRKRGGPSHAASLTTYADWPEPLASAALGEGGKDRVRRFQVYARHRSLNDAAIALSLHTSVLTLQLARLESACGGELITRSPRSQQRQRITGLGGRLLAQADDHLGHHPNAPRVLPEPLATALASFWGLKRLRGFETAARSDSLAAAAPLVGTDRYTLDRSLRGLEQAVGGALLDRSGPSQPHQLTALGRQLLDQMGDHRGATA
jgi:hypothetical protein